MGSRQGEIRASSARWGSTGCTVYSVCRIVVNTGGTSARRFYQFRRNVSQRAVYSKIRLMSYRTYRIMDNILLREVVHRYVSFEMVHVEQKYGEYSIIVL